MWKEVNWAYDRQLGAWNELEDLVKRAAEFEKSLTKLEGEIDKELKQQGKGAKPDKDIQKLHKQIEDDLKEMKVIQVKFKKAAPCDKNLEKEFAKEIKYVESADPSATKFGKASANYFEKGILQKSADKCKIALKKANTEAGLAVAAARKGSTKEAEVYLKACGLEIQKILKFEKVYSKLNATFKKDIADSDDKKMIENAIAQFAEFKEEAGKLFTNAAAEIKKQQNSNQKRGWSPQSALDEFNPDRNGLLFLSGIIILIAGCGAGKRYQVGRRHLQFQRTHHGDGHGFRHRRHLGPEVGEARQPDTGGLPALCRPGVQLFGDVHRRLGPAHGETGLAHVRFHDLVDQLEDPAGIGQRLKVFGRVPCHQGCGPGLHDIE